jgi:hypothetical protein
VIEVAPPAEVLTQLEQLEIPLGVVRDAVDSLLNAARAPDSTLRLGDALDAIEQGVNSWLAAAKPVEDALMSPGQASPDDLPDTQYRLGGLAMVHFAIASDVAAVAPVEEDDTSPETLVREIGQRTELPDQGSMSRGVVGEGLLRDLSRPIGEERQAGFPGEHEGSEVIDKVVTDIVERAGKACTAVLTGIVGLPDWLGENLRVVMEATPASIRKFVEMTTRRINRLVGALVQRATFLLDSVIPGNRRAGKRVLRQSPLEATEPLEAGLISKLVKAGAVRSEAKRRLAPAPDRAARIRRISEVEKLHSRCVGPVRWVAQGLAPLNGVIIGPVPVAPIVATALLGWTVLVTGDQLDSPGPLFPDVWIGVLRRAAGE